MNYRLFFFAAILGLMLSGCTTRAKIQIIDVSPATKISDEFRHVEFFESTDEAHYENLNSDGFTAVKFSANKDLERILMKKEMHHLYYNLTKCDDRDDEVLFGRVFKKNNDNEPYYYAFLPNDLTSAIKSYVEGFRYPDEPEQVLQSIKPASLCIDLGAGSMLGSSIETNSIEVNFLDY